jgi:XRE family aerobic/anaerobic benzoate catabolism transcriptional regulator
MTKAVDNQESLFLAELGRRVRTMRALHGMSRKVLAQASGISERYIAQLESGQGNASIILLRRAASAMGTRLEDLIDDGGARSPEWGLMRELLVQASPEQITAAKALLSNGGAPHAAAATTQRVALIGLRGAGKSTLGRIAAERLGWPFIELNKQIEATHALAISEIFALYGQEGYRRMEQEAVQQLIQRPGPMLLATAGGVVSEPLTYDLVCSSFFTVWLKAKPEEHMQRVRDQGDLRPMSDNRSAMDELRAILRSRESLYARARVTVDTSGLKVDEAAARLLDAIAPHTGRTGRDGNPMQSQDRSA